MSSAKRLPAVLLLALLAPLPVLAAEANGSAPASASASPTASATETSGPERAAPPAASTPAAAGEPAASSQANEDAGPPQGDSGESQAASSAGSEEARGGSGAPTAMPKLEGLVVFVDPGHGGKADGAIGAQGQKEKEVVLQLAKRLKKALEKAGAKVLLTRDRDKDVDLWDRIVLANQAKADLFVSVHCNAMPYGRVRKTTHGIETYFLSAEATAEQAQRVVALENGETKRLKRSTDPLANILDDLAQTEAHHESSTFAYAVHQRIVADLGAPDRGVQQAPFIVLMGARMPAILVEVGFISHPEEGKLLSDKDYQQRIAASLVAGIDTFVEERAARLGVAGAASEPKAEPAKAAEAPAN